MTKTFTDQTSVRNAPVAQLLENTRGYGGNVTYRENATKTAATIGVQQFANWENYDVIHLTGHGTQVCDVNRCVATILTGDIYSDAADLLQLTELGLNTAHVRASARLSRAASTSLGVGGRLPAMSRSSLKILCIASALLSTWTGASTRNMRALPGSGAAPGPFAGKDSAGARHRLKCRSSSAVMASRAPERQLKQRLVEYFLHSNSLQSAYSAATLSRP